ncbi:hypothetical protein [Coraliomargarita parva]|uniref:hypothetical protein n=1 Tax=Coraliomargarita parva TaxID=3014050 RepID=UPI0022B405B0|nr:hypothetical protein [Coraliomargarita parva]
MKHYRIVLSFALLCLAHLPAFAVDDPELDKILQKHVEAMGGWKNWNQVESIRLAGTIKRDGQSVDFVIVKKRPDQIRATITLPIPGNEEEKVQVIRAHDGKEAWTATRLAGAQEIEKELLDPAASRDLLADAGVLPKLIDLWQSGAELELMEPKTTKGEACFVIQAKMDGGKQEFLFELSANTFELRRYVTIIDGSKSSTSELSEYQSIDGIRLPTHCLIHSKKTGESSMRTESVELGVGIYEDYFHGRSEYTFNK